MMWQLIYIYTNDSYNIKHKMNYVNFMQTYLLNLFVIILLIYAYTNILNNKKTHTHKII
jgi:hypothetical protein